MTLQESGEMYLETIYVLSRKKSHVRAIDVAEYMGYSKPSVSRALGLLKQGGYLTTGARGSPTLTELGTDTVAKIYARHTVIRDMLIRMGVDEETAAQDACRMEHVISDASFQAICRHLNRENAGD